MPQEDIYTLQVACTVLVFFSTGLTPDSNKHQIYKGECFSNKRRKNVQADLQEWPVLVRIMC